MDRKEGGGVKNQESNPVNVGDEIMQKWEAGMTREEHLAQRMKSWRFRLWYRWYGFLFKIKMMLGRDVK